MQHLSSLARLRGTVAARAILGFAALGEVAVLLVATRTRVSLTLPTRDHVRPPPSPTTSVLAQHARTRPSSVGL
jgi:hypothetical protein